MDNLLPFVLIGTSFGVTIYLAVRFGVRDGGLDLMKDLERLWKKPH
jgi:hypothetical protein